MAFDDTTEVLKRHNETLEQCILVREVKLRLRSIESVQITIRIWFDIEQRDQYRFDLSHYVHSPVQAGPYIPSAPWCPTEALALEGGIEALTNWVESGQKEGHEPSPSWLIPAHDFD